MFSFSSTCKKDTSIKRPQWPLIFLAAALCGQNVQAAKIEAGKVRFFNKVNSQFNEQQKNWLTSHYYRLLAYSPSFDKKNTWYPGGMAYVNSYAIYRDDALAKSHPEWIMRDAKGNKLYIPWDCGGGSCTQYAGDFSNPIFRRYMVQKIKAIASKGYKGIWLDDVNLIWRVGNNNDENQHITPIDSNTRKPMTLANWRRYFGQYMQEIRAALPKTVEISHNAIWYADSMARENPDITRQIRAANYINLERGGNDGGLVGGTGQWGYETFLKYIDYVHKQGTGVILMDDGNSTTEREYGLATWFLVSQGNDLYNSTRSDWTNPTSWWQGFSLNLGKAINNHYKWHSVLRRDFTCGSVLLNQPGRPTLHLTMGNGYKNLSGKAASSITLEAKSAAILTKPCAAAS